MRVNSTSASLNVSRTETKSTTTAQPATTKAATTAQPVTTAQPAQVAAQARHLPGHGIVDGGCFPPPPSGPTFPPFPPFPGKPSPADAKTRATQGDQLHDIADGVRDGSLTEKETEKLLKEQQAIADAQKSAMADGKLSLGEKLKLAVMQARADHNIEQARNNRNRDFFAPFDSDARRQAAQIDQIANGRTNGNITNFEAGKLLGQQADIADARDNTGPFNQLLTDFQQNKAQQDINLHSKPGTQFDFKPLPFPQPRPLPKPFPLPEPLPRPQLPRPELPKIDLPIFRANHIVG